MTGPTVTIAIPTYNEEAHIDACLDAIARQTYPMIVEVLVVDGGSSDRTCEFAAARGARVIENPRRIQAAGLNIALDAAAGDVFVRVDGHCVIADDYVSRCVDALGSTGASIVGGGMTPIASGWLQEGIAAAMASPVGAGPARFHVGGRAGWVDTVYLGAYRTADARAVGGYAEDVGVNEDAEFAIRMSPRGGIWFDPAIRSSYVPRKTLGGVARQFYRYGRSRAATARRHPRSVSPRQVVPPVLVIALLLPGRRRVVAAYVLGVVCVAANEGRRRRSGPVASAFAVALPAMHLPWGAGFLVGLYQSTRPPRR
jgi:glycosyltransferase involved in cell wall biosynthesis